MKATLEYILPEDGTEYKNATMGTVYYVMLHNIYNVCRNHTKYGANSSEIISQIKEMIGEIDDL